MRILVVSQYFWPENFRINEVSKTLQEKGVQLEVLTGKPNYPEGRIYSGYHMWGCQREQFDAAPLHRIPLIPRGKKSSFQLAANYLSFIFFGLLCGPWLLRGRRYDAILVHGMSPILQAIPALFLGWIKRIPVIIWVQDLWPESLSATGYVRNGLVIRLVRRIVRFIYEHADLLLVQSQAFVAPVAALAGKTPIVYYPNSVDDAFAKPALDEPPAVEGLGDGFSVMFAGNIGAAQAVEVIVEAATLLRDQVDIHFVVLGDGSAREWMQNEVRQRGLANVHLPGRFPMATMPGFMQKASALLVTLADREIFAATVPNKVQAYLAAGRPIIACLPGEGARLVVDAKAGVGVRAEDGKALAEAVLSLYRMSESERDEMGRNGRAYFFEHYDHERLVDQLIDELREVVQRKGSMR
ncbi:glycosyltransferase family 4 protein [Sideroxydans sp.]